MTAIYTWDVFSTLDGYGSYGEGGDWGGYWGKQGPELLEHRAALSRRPSSGWSSGPPPSGRSLQIMARASIPTRSTTGTSGR